MNRHRPDDTRLALVTRPSLLPSPQSPPPHPGRCQCPVVTHGAMGVGAHRATFVGSLGADGTDVGSLGGVAEESPPTSLPPSLPSSCEGSWSPSRASGGQVVAAGRAAPSASSSAPRPPSEPFPGPACVPSAPARPPPSPGVRLAGASGWLGSRCWANVWMNWWARAPGGPQGCAVLGELGASRTHRHEQLRRPDKSEREPSFYKV